MVVCEGVLGETGTSVFFIPKLPEIVERYMRTLSRSESAGLVHDIFMLPVPGVKLTPVTFPGEVVSLITLMVMVLVDEKSLLSITLALI